MATTTAQSRKINMFEAQATVYVNLAWYIPKPLSKHPNMQPDRLSIFSVKPNCLFVSKLYALLTTKSVTVTKSVFWINTGNRFLA